MTVKIEDVSSVVLFPNTAAVFERLEKVGGDETIFTH